MGSRHFDVDGTPAFVAACDAAEADEARAERRYILASELVEQHRQAFVDWFNRTAHEDVLLEPIMHEAFDILTDRLLAGETPTYELSALYTGSMLPEHFRLPVSPDAIDEVQS